VGNCVFKGKGIAPLNTEAGGKSSGNDRICERGTKTFIERRRLMEHASSRQGEKNGGLGIARALERVLRLIENEDKQLKVKNIVRWD